MSVCMGDRAGKSGDLSQGTGSNSSGSWLPFVSHLAHACSVVKSVQLSGTPKTVVFLPGQLPWAEEPGGQAIIHGGGAGVAVAKSQIQFSNWACISSCPYPSPCSLPVNLGNIFFFLVLEPLKLPLTLAFAHSVLSAASSTTSVNGGLPTSGCHPTCPWKDLPAYPMGRHPSITLSLHPASWTQAMLMLPGTDHSMDSDFTSNFLLSGQHDFRDWLQALMESDLWGKASLPLGKNNHPLKVKLLVAQSCPTLCNPLDGNSPGSSVHGILQARIPGWVEWVAIPLSKRSS